MDESKKLNLNVASFAELVQIPILGETRARILIAKRPFSSWDDLRRRAPGFEDGAIEDLHEAGVIIE